MLPKQNAVGPAPSCSGRNRESQLSAPGHCVLFFSGSSEGLVWGGADLHRRGKCDPKQKSLESLFSMRYGLKARGSGKKRPVF